MLRLKWFCFWKPVKYLELAITDFCNLKCRLCAQGVPLQKNKKEMSFKELKRISTFFKHYEFDVIKVSGGEPTLHSQFPEICDNLKELFPAYFYKLATNGCLLEKYIENVLIFDQIDLSNYPGQNDDVYFRIVSLNIPNIYAFKKEDYIQMVDISQEKNLTKTNIYNSCINKNVKKIVQSRIYPCCNIFGQSFHQDISQNKISGLVDENWKKNLKKVNIEPYCKRCWTNVVTVDHIPSILKLSRNIRRNFSEKKSLYQKKKIQNRLKNTA
jgi:sulfatase maturation enzyme AslB (radical SAM superfamily)